MSQRRPEAPAPAHDGSPPPTALVLEGPRVLLRSPRATDVPEVRRVLRRNENHLRPWSPAPPPGEDPTSLTEISKAILRQRREWKRGEAYLFYVTLRGDAETIIGRVALTSVVRGAFRNAYLGYWIDADYQNRGLMTEAVAQATTFAFEQVKLHRVQAAVMPANAGSLRLLDKLAFRREGVALRYLQIAGRWEDHVIFAVTTEEWRHP